MSVAAPNNEDAEALRRAQKAHEPSMEEILASIRAIIADDRDPSPPKSVPQIVYSSDGPTRPLPVALKPIDEPEPPLPGPTVVWSRNEEPPALKRETTPLPPEESEHDDEPLLSEETEDAVAASFESLSESLTAHGFEVAEQMAREMLRPMLKAWLDENLPSMVEKLVRAEIQRLARVKR